MISRYWPGSSRLRVTADILWGSNRYRESELTLVSTSDSSRTNYWRHIEVPVPKNCFEFEKVINESTIHLLFIL